MVCLFNFFLKFALFLNNFLKKNRPFVKDIFQSISAKVGPDPCCDWVGEDGAGHFVKMVHNGIEYGDMQLICEAYDLLHNALDLSLDDISNVFFILLIYTKNKTDQKNLELIKILISRFSKIGIKAIWTHS